MAKATVKLPDNTKITIEGSEEEVKNLLSVYSGQISKKARAKKWSGRVKKTKDRTQKTRKAENTPTNLIRKLIEEGFFAKKRGIKEVKDRLRSLGHVLEEEDLGAPLLRLTRQEELSREKGPKGWEYKTGE